jgi:anti-sigma28 factor (negative regulator of flagellin synthesis)
MGKTEATPITQSHGPHEGSRAATQGTFKLRTVVKISVQQIEAVLATQEPAAANADAVDETVIRLVDKELIEATLAKVNSMPDREDFVAELKAKIDSGQYNPTGEEIADAMIRRTLADRVR